MKTGFHRPFFHATGHFNYLIVCSHYSDETGGLKSQGGRPNVLRTLLFNEIVIDDDIACVFIMILHNNMWPLAVLTGDNSYEDSLFENVWLFLRAERNGRINEVTKPMFRSDEGLTLETSAF